MTGKYDHNGFPTADYSILLGQPPVRRRIQNDIVIAPDTNKALPQQLSLIEPAESMAALYIILLQFTVLGHRGLWR